MSMPEILTPIAAPISILTDYRPFPEVKWSDTGLYLGMVINEPISTGNTQQREGVYHLDK